MNWPSLSIVIFADADPGGCVRILTDCERLEHEAINFEVILVLQGLSEKVETMLKSYSFSFDLKFLSTDPETNRARGRNLGVKASKGEIILFLDSTLEVSPGLLYRHLEAYESDDTTAVMGEIFLPKFVKKSRWYRFLDGNYRSTRRWAAKADSQTSPPLRYVNTSNFSVRRSSYDTCGGHAEHISHHEAEDIDLAFRITNQNHKLIHHAPEAVAFCLHHSLKESLRLKYEFGKEGIPKLLKAYPELYSRLPSRFVFIAGFPSVAPLYRTFMNILFTRPVYFLARGIRLLSPEFVAFRMMRYMLQAQSVRGVKAAMRAKT